MGGRGHHIWEHASRASGCYCTCACYARWRAPIPVQSPRHTSPLSIPLHPPLPHAPPAREPIPHTAPPHGGPMGASFPCAASSPTHLEGLLDRITCGRRGAIYSCIPIYSGRCAGTRRGRCTMELVYPPRASSDCSKTVLCTHKTYACLLTPSPPRPPVPCPLSSQAKEATVVLTTSRQRRSSSARRPRS